MTRPLAILGTILLMLCVGCSKTPAFPPTAPGADEVPVSVGEGSASAPSARTVAPPFAITRRVAYQGQETPAQIKPGEGVEVSGVPVGTRLEVKASVAGGGTFSYLAYVRRGSSSAVTLMASGSQVTWPVAGAAFEANKQDWDISKAVVGIKDTITVGLGIETLAGQGDQAGAVDFRIRTYGSEKGLISVEPSVVSRDRPFTAVDVAYKMPWRIEMNGRTLRRGNGKSSLFLNVGPSDEGKQDLVLKDEAGHEVARTPVTVDNSPPSILSTWIADVEQAGSIRLTIGVEATDSLSPIDPASVTIASKAYRKIGEPIASESIVFQDFEISPGAMEAPVSFEVAIQDQVGNEGTARWQPTGVDEVWEEASVDPSGYGIANLPQTRAPALYPNCGGERTLRKRAAARRYKVVNGVETPYWPHWTIATAYITHADSPTERYNRLPKYPPIWPVFVPVNQLMDGASWPADLQNPVKLKYASVKATWDGKDSDGVTPARTGPYTLALSIAGYFETTSLPGERLRVSDYPCKKVDDWYRVADSHGNSPRIVTDNDANHIVARHLLNPEHPGYERKSHFWHFDPRLQVYRSELEKLRPPPPYPAASQPDFDFHKDGAKGYPWTRALMGSPLADSLWNVGRLATAAYHAGRTCPSPGAVAAMIASGKSGIGAELWLAKCIAVKWPGGGIALVKSQANAAAVETVFPNQELTDFEEQSIELVTSP